MAKSIRNNLATYLALAHSLPIVGREFNCFVIVFVGGNIVPIKTKTSVVTEISDLGSNIYRVATCDSIYYVKVG